MAGKEVRAEASADALSEVLGEVRDTLRKQSDRDVLFRRSAQGPTKVVGIPDETTIEDVCRQATRAAMKLGNQLSEWTPADKDTPNFMHARDHRTGAMAFARIRVGSQHGERFASFGGDACMKSYSKNAEGEQRSVNTKMVNAVPQ